MEIKIIEGKCYNFEGNPHHGNPEFFRGVVKVGDLRLQVSMFANEYFFVTSVTGGFTGGIWVHRNGLTPLTELQEAMYGD